MAGAPASASVFRPTSPVFSSPKLDLLSPTTQANDSYTSPADVGASTPIAKTSSFNQSVTPMEARTEDPRLPRRSVMPEMPVKMEAPAGVKRGGTWPTRSRNVPSAPRFQHRPDVYPEPDPPFGLEGLRAPKLDTGDSNSTSLFNRASKWDDLLDDDEERRNKSLTFPLGTARLYA